MRARATLVGLAVAAAAAVGAAPAAAATWDISPTLINETTATAAQVQTGINDGYFETYPSQTLAPGNAPNENGNSSAYEFVAPHLGEGADGMVVYDTADGSQFNMLAQDDANPVGVPNLASPSCTLADPTGPAPAYSCAGTYGGNGPYPNNPSLSSFDPYFNLRDNAPNAPAGARPATVTAAGQSCSAELANGASSTCTADQPTMTGLSPTDPDNYQTLLFVDTGSTPVTVTDTDSFAASLSQQHPGVCVEPDTGQPDQNCNPPSTSCTMQWWGQTCMLQTSGGANSLATILWPDSSGELQEGHATSDQISISPGASSPSGEDWYGVRVYSEAELSRHSVSGFTLFGLFDAFISAYASTYTDQAGGLPFYWDPAIDDGIVTRSAELAPGRALAPGQALRRGPYELAMQTDGDLVEEVAVNGRRYRVWSSQTRDPGARLALGHDGVPRIRGRDGTVKWSARTHGRRGARFGVEKDGRIVLRDRDDRPLFTTSAVSYPLPTQAGGRAIPRGLGLLPGGELRLGSRRLAMQTDGNLVLTRGRHTLWTSGTRGHPGAYARLRNDGELIVATAHGAVLWSSRTRGRGATRLELRADGTIALVDRTHHLLWKAGRRR